MLFWTKLFKICFCCVPKFWDNVMRSKLWQNFRFYVNRPYKVEYVSISYWISFWITKLQCFHAHGECIIYKVSLFIFSHSFLFPPCIVCDLSRLSCSVSCLNRRPKSKQQLKFLWFCHSALPSAASRKRRSPLAAGALISESKWNNNNSDNEFSSEPKLFFHRAQLSRLRQWVFPNLWCPSLSFFLFHTLFGRHVYNRVRDFKRLSIK